MTENTIAPWAELAPDVDSCLTADDLYALPEDRWKYELVRGRLVRMPPTGIEHSDTMWDLALALRRIVNAHNLGIVTLPETGYVISGTREPQIVLAPDIGYIRADRVPPPGSRARRRYFQGPPDLAVETASPSQHRPELAEKARLWLEGGVRLV